MNIVILNLFILSIFYDTLLYQITVFSGFRLKNLLLFYLKSNKDSEMQKDAPIMYKSESGLWKDATCGQCLYQHLVKSL